MITLKDIQINNHQMSLSKLVESPIKDVVFSFSREWGMTSIILHSIEFEDGTHVLCEGEHDMPYVTSGYKKTPKNFVEDTLDRLYKEYDSDD